MVLDTDLPSDDVYYQVESDEAYESVNFYSNDTGEIVASFELNYANPMSRAQSTGSYRKYMANGLTLIHSFAYEYINAGTRKQVTAIKWDRVSTEGWSMFSITDNPAHNVYIAGSGGVGGNYSVSIEAVVTASMASDDIVQKTLKALGFSVSVEISTTMSVTKTFDGSWTLSVNPNPGCTTTMCPTSIN